MSKRSIIIDKILNLIITHFYAVIWRFEDRGHFDISELNLFQWNDFISILVQ